VKSASSPRYRSRRDQRELCDPAAGVKWPVFCNLTCQLICSGRAIGSLFQGGRRGGSSIRRSGRIGRSATELKTPSMLRKERRQLLAKVVDAGDENSMKNSSCVWR
jgi:hypothetical protein